MLVLPQRVGDLFAGRGSFDRLRGGGYIEGYAKKWFEVPIHCPCKVLKVKSSLP